MPCYLVRVKNELSTLGRECAGRLWPGRPQSSAPPILNVQPLAPIIQGRVWTPACQGDVLPAAVSSAGVGEGDAVPAVGKEMHGRQRRLPGNVPGLGN